MLLILTDNMIAECPSTDCNRMGKIKKNIRELKSEFWLPSSDISYII
jgi:hypothetical protein